MHLNTRERCGRRCRAAAVAECDVRHTAKQVGLKAYLLWEANGRPEGGDFSEQARDELRAELRSGKSLQEVEQAMRAVRACLTCCWLCRRSAG